MTAIASANLVWYLSGGSGNSSPVASLGGAISSTAWSTTTALDDLFPDVTGAQAAAGVTQYLCLYMKNTDTNANGLLSGAVYFLTQVTPADANDKIAVALGTAAKNGTEQTVANITTAPSAVTWIDASTAISVATGATLPTPMSTNDYQSVWFRRTIGAGATATGAVSTITSFSGDGTTGTITCSGGCVTATGDVVTISGTSATSFDGTYQTTGGNHTTTLTIATTVTSATITGAHVTRPSGTYIAVGGDTTA